MTESQKRARILSALDYYERTLRKRADGDRSEGTVKRVRAELAKAIDEAFAAPVQVAPPSINPYTGGVAAENWRRGFEGERFIGPNGSAARGFFDEGVKARRTVPAPVAPQDDARDAADTKRLNWLDEVNQRLKIGWRVSVAPAGNVSVGGVIQLSGKATTIREAIDAAMPRPAAKPTEPTLPTQGDAK